MAKKRVKNQEVKEEEVLQAPVAEQEQVIEMSPLPSEQETVQAKEEVKETRKVDPITKPAPKHNKVYYAFCRVSGGLVVDITNSLGEVSKKILKSANTSEVAGDGTRVFNFRPDAFGITPLTEDEAKQIKERLQPSRCWKKGFVFIAESEEEGMKIAKEQVAKYPLQGTEQINTSSAKEVEKFSE